MAGVAVSLLSSLLVARVRSLDLQETGPLLGWVPGGYPRVSQSDEALVAVVQPDPTPTASSTPSTSERKTPSVTAVSTTEAMNSTVQPGMYNPFEVFEQWQSGNENKTLLDFITSENVNASIASAGPVLKLPKPFDFDLNMSADSSLTGQFVGDDSSDMLPRPRAGASNSETVGDSYYDHSATGKNSQDGSSSFISVNHSLQLTCAILVALAFVELV